MFRTSLRDADTRDLRGVEQIPAAFVPSDEQILLVLGNRHTFGMTDFDRFAVGKVKSKRAKRGAIAHLAYILNFHVGQEFLLDIGHDCNRLRLGSRAGSHTVGGRFPEFFLGDFFDADEVRVAATDGNEVVEVFS